LEFIEAGVSAPVGEVDAGGAGVPGVYDNAE